MIAYDTEADIMEISDFYDFTSSYLDAEWEDVDDDGNTIERDDDNDISEGCVIHESLQLILTTIV
jgi:pre-60S factor REI1